MDIWEDVISADLPLTANIGIWRNILPVSQLVELQNHPNWNLHSDQWTIELVVTQVLFFISYLYPFFYAKLPIIPR